MKIALVGCGAAAERYYIPALKKHPEILQDLFLVDRNRSQAQRVADLLGKGVIVEDYKSILDKVHGAIIALPNFLHYEVGLDFLNSKAHVLCEKPLADTYEKASEMVAAAQKNNVILFVNNTRRLFPVNQAIKQLFFDKQLGRLKSIQYTEGAQFGWASATGFYVNPKVSAKGLLSDLGPHVIDILSWWFGGELELIRFTDDSFGGPESVIKIEAKYNGCSIDIFLNRMVDLDSGFEIQCERGSVIGKPMDWGSYTVRPIDGKPKTIRIPCAQKNYPAFMMPIVNNFFRTIQGVEKPLITGEEVLPSLAFIDQCYKERNRFAMPWYDQIQVASAPKEETVLVTGATGFIGASIVEKLHLSNDRKVKAVVHSWANAARLGRFPVNIVEMDLMDERSIDTALEGVSTIIHCAKGGYDVTVNGTKNLQKVALQRGIRRFVHLSTSEVYGNKEGEIREETPFEYTGNEYNRMKIDAEKICWQYSQEGLPVAILRPSIVYGPFSKNWTLHIARMLIEKKLGIYEEIGEGKCNLVYIDDLIEAVLLALDSDKAVGQAFNIVGPNILTWNEYFKMMNDALNLDDIRVIHRRRADVKTTALIPVRFVGGIVKNYFMGPVKKVAENISLADSVMRRVEKTLKTTPVKDELHLFARNSIYNSEKATNLIGFNPAVDPSKGIEMSSRWIVHNQVCGNSYV